MGKSSLTRLAEIAPGRFAHASGALWLPETGTALIADAHLGYGWALRRRGSLGPVADSKSEPKLAGVVEELRPRTIVFLGDVVHAPRPSTQERQDIAATLLGVGQGRELIVVRGNHDRGFVKDFGHLGFAVAEEWRSPGLLAIHGDRLERYAPSKDHMVVGHIHPCLKMRDAAGASQKIPVFLTSARATVLPAFSPYAAGVEAGSGLSRQLQGLLGRQNFRVVAVSGKRAVPLGLLEDLKTDAAWELGPGRRRRKTKGDASTSA